jgi:UDPglucose 6-dehydrogenase
VQLNLVRDFYQSLFPKAEISLCTSLESESMKIFCNTFYAVKVQYFTELYLICQKNGSDYDKIRDMMLKNGWINKMHTVIPGPDGQISYGGLCFPKDTNALLKYMEKLNTDNKVLKATVEERNDMREDHENCKKV